MSINELKFEFKKDYGYFPVEFSEPLSFWDKLKNNFGNAFGDNALTYKLFKKFNPSSTEKEFKKVQAEILKRGFRLSKAMQADMVQEMIDTIDLYEKENKPLSELADLLNNRLVEKGFLQDSSTKQKASRINLIIDTAISVTRAKQVFNEMQNAPDSMRYRMLSQIDRAGKRHEHTALLGKVYDTKDPSFALLMMPKGFGCGCEWSIIITEDELKDYEIGDINKDYADLSENDKLFNPLEDFKPETKKYDKSIARKIMDWFQ
jgi:hypothetical protein